MSSTLDSTQKAGVQKAIGTMASSLYMTMAKLYLCAPNETAWRDSEIWGACSVVFDRTPPSSRHIKIFETESGNYELKWSQELYENLQYNAPSAQFHTFEGHQNIIGLSFEDPNEATEFMNTVKRMVPHTDSHLSTGSAGSGQKKKSGLFSKLFGGGKQKNVEIGRPTDVQHVQHIGFDPNTGFDVTHVPAEWASIFKNAGIKKKDLQNPETAKVIYETLSAELNNEARYAAAPPPIPSTYTTGGQSSIPPPQPPQPPPLPPTQNGSSSIPVPPPIAPPLPPSIPTAPVISANAPVAPPAPPSFPTDRRSSTVGHEEKSSAAPSSDNLLAAIQAGTKLRKVQAPSKDSALPDVKQLNQEETNTLASVLQKAMASRLQQVKTEDNDEEEDDWD